MFKLFPQVVDFGCAELGFLVYLKGISEVQQILCVDVDRNILETYKKKAAPLITEMLSSRERMLTIEICEGSVTDNDVKLKHANAVICIELYVLILRKHYLKKLFIYVSLILEIIFF